MTRGALYLDRLPTWRRVSVELRSNENRAIPGVQVVESNFIDWKPDSTYDAVLCLQVLEHVVDPAAFASKLFSCANSLVVISIPYKWEPGAEKTHCHDPVDELKLASWVKREPLISEIVDVYPYRRLVAAYDANTVRQ